MLEAIDRNLDAELLISSGDDKDQIEVGPDVFVVEGAIVDARESAQLIANILSTLRTDEKTDVYLEMNRREKLALFSIS